MADGPIDIPDTGFAGISVQVIYAAEQFVWMRSLRLPMGSTVTQAVQDSGFAMAFPNVADPYAAVGVFGQVCTPSRVLNEGDRVEIYRSLTFDALESRRRRALHRKAFMVKPPNRPKRKKARLAAAQQRDAGK